MQLSARDYPNHSHYRGQLRILYRVQFKPLGSHKGCPYKTLVGVALVATRMLINTPNYILVRRKWWRCLVGGARVCVTVSPMDLPVLDARKRVPPYGQYR